MSQSPIFTKTEAMLKWLLEHTAKFPRHERFRLAKRITDAAFDLHTHLLYAVQTSETHHHLTQADVALNQLRSYIRLAVEMGYTTDRQFKHAAGFTTEIGKMIGGWKKKALSEG